MSGPLPGKYFIQVEARFSAGVDFGPGPVITDADDNIWNVKKLEDGNYTLCLVGFRAPPDPLCARADAGKVVADSGPPSPWSIRRLDDGFYTIEVPSFRPTRAWTVNGPIVPKAPVLLEILFEPLPGQKWSFIPVLDSK